MKIPDSEKLAEDLTKTLICQAHLSPLPLHVVPIYWNYDHVMRLYPLPDLVVCAVRVVLLAPSIGLPLILKFTTSTVACLKGRRCSHRSA